MLGNVVTGQLEEINDEMIILLVFMKTVKMIEAETKTPLERLEEQLRTNCKCHVRWVVNTDEKLDIGIYFHQITSLQIIDGSFDHHFSKQVSVG